MEEATLSLAEAFSEPKKKRSVLQECWTQW